MKRKRSHVKKQTQQRPAEISGYLADGDTASVKSYVKESLSEEELAQIQEIYEKYQDELSEYLE